MIIIQIFCKVLLYFSSSLHFYTSHIFSHIFVIYVADVNLPALFMPHRSSSGIYNPRAHQYFHPGGEQKTHPSLILQLFFSELCI